MERMLKTLQFAIFCLLCKLHCVTIQCFFTAELLIADYVTYRIFQASRLPLIYSTTKPPTPSRTQLLHIASSIYSRNCTESLPTMDSTPTRIISSPSLDYHCQPCGIFMCMANIDSHLAGKKHRTRCTELGTVEADCALAPAPSVAVPHLVAANGGTDIPQALVDASGSEADKETTTDGVEKNMASGMHYCDRTVRAM